MTRKKAGGERYEDKVVFELHRGGAVLERSEQLDLFGCVDFSIRRFPETPLPKPIDVQLTFQGGNADKLERFVRTQERSGRDTLRVYAVVPTGMKADEAAHQIHLFAFVAARDGTFERASMTGLFLNKKDTYQPFDIDARLIQLRRREDPLLSADRRVLGHIVSVGENGSAKILSVEDSKKYHMRMGDAVTPGLKALLKNPEDFADMLIGRKVTFIPHRQHALSVLLA